MTSFTISAAVASDLNRHLEELEEAKFKFIDECFPEPSKERTEFEEMMIEYLKQVNYLLKKGVKSQDADSNIPFVIIGTEVEVQDLTDQEIYKYHIVNPLRDNLKPGDVSFLSPVGKSLLLNRVGDIVEVNAPAGIFKYKIISIRLRLS